jgi:hypothetical protein
MLASVIFHMTRATPVSEVKIFGNGAELLLSTRCRPSSPRQRLVWSAVKRTFTLDFYT